MGDDTSRGYDAEDSCKGSNPERNPGKDHGKLLGKLNGTGGYAPKLIYACMCMCNKMNLF